MSSPHSVWMAAQTFNRFPRVRARLECYSSAYCGIEAIRGGYQTACGGFEDSGYMLHLATVTLWRVTVWATWYTKAVHP